MSDTRLDKQLEFILEIDKLKSVYRQSYLVNGSRKENSAEHCWHVAIMAMLLCEHADENANPVRVMKMLLIHDIIEIDAGDTYFYDPSGMADKAEREQQAADRLFSILPDDQQREFMELWREYEDGETNDAKFAASLDRLMPLLHNYHTKGKSWQEHSVTVEKVMQRVLPDIEPGSKVLFEKAADIIGNAVTKGYLRG